MTSGDFDAHATSSMVSTPGHVYSVFCPHVVDTLSTLCILSIAKGKVGSPVVSIKNFKKLDIERNF